MTTVGTAVALDQALEATADALQTLGPAAADRHAVDNVFTEFLLQVAPEVDELNKQARREPSGAIATAMRHVCQAYQALAEDQVAEARSAMVAARAALAVLTANRHEQ